MSPYRLALGASLCVACSSQSSAGSAAAMPQTQPPQAQLSQELEVDVRSLDEESKEDKRGLEEKLADASPPPVQAPEPGKGQKLKNAKRSPPDPQPEGAALQRLPGRVQGATSEKVAANVDPSLIQRAVATHPELFDRCLQGSDVSIEIDATIAPSGKVIEAKCTRSVPDDPKLRDCVVEGFRRLSVGALTNDVPARVKFALALKRRG